jgi:hypothetical protein
MRRSFFKITVHTLAVILWALPLLSLHANPTALQDSGLLHHPNEEVMTDCSAHHPAGNSNLPHQPQPGEVCGSGHCDLCSTVQIVMMAEAALGIPPSQSTYMTWHPNLHPEPVLFPFLRPPEHNS